VLAAWYISGVGATALSAENVWFVQKLNENKPWDRFTESPIPIRVEGRIGSFGGGQFRLLYCDARFVVDNSKLKFVQPRNVIEVKGKFRKDGSKVEFAVDELKVMSGYFEQFETSASKVKRPTPEDWIELGDWAAERARFYDDADLTKKADEAYMNAIEVEYNSLKPTDAEGRFALADKIEHYKLSNRRRLELIHEGLRIQWKAEQKVDPPKLAAWKNLVTAVEARLPGANEIIKKLSADLKQKYEQDPISVYRDTDEKQRPQLHRLFLVEITRKTILQDVAPDGRNGDTIADRIDKSIPEEHPLAEKYRGLQLDYGLEHVSTMTRAEIEKLALTFRARGQNENSKKALQQWIKSHEQRLKGDGVIGLVQLADEHLSLLGDEAIAIEYLKDAYRIDPQFEETKNRFASLGYSFQGSRWVKATARPTEAVAERSQSPTGVNVGMTATELRNLLGQPRSLARVLTGRGVTEIWSYGNSGGSPFVFRLEQKSREPEPKVTVIPASKE
jgi:tetratricopeptide (TPR) repeat protein